MTGVTHGADAERLREVADALRGHGQRVKEVGDRIGPIAQALEESWGGPDAAAMIAEIDGLRPTVASAGATVIAWAEELRAQADEQTGASGGAGATGGSGAGGGGGNSQGRPAPAGPTRQEVWDHIKDIVGGMSDGGGDGDTGMRNPFAAAIDRPRFGNDPLPDVEPRNVIDGKPGGDEKRTGSSSHTDSTGKNIKLSHTTTGSTSDAGVDAQGRGLQTTTVTGTTELSAEGSAKVGRIGVDGKAFAGTESSWAVTGPDGTDAASVNPLDPTNMPEGTSARLGSSWYTGNGLGASYKLLSADMGTKSGTEHYVEVSRGEGDEVTVVVGDDDFDKAKSSLGLGTDDVSARLSADSDFTQGRAKEVTFDLSTQEGQDAYNRFVLLGKAPQADAPGVVDVADVEAFSGSRSTGASVSLWDKTFGSSDSNWNAGGLSKQHADGSETVEWSGKDGSTQVGGSTHIDPDGNVDRDKSTYYLRQRDVDADVAHEYNQHQGSGVRPSQSQNVAISLTPDDLQAMRYTAAESAAARINNEPEWYRGTDIDDGRQWTADDVLEYVDGHPDRARGLDGIDTASTDLLASQDDSEILRAMSAEGPVEFQNELAREYSVHQDNYRGHRGKVTSTGTD